MIQYTDIAADFEKSDTSANMFEMEKPPAVLAYEESYHKLCFIAASPPGSGYPVLTGRHTAVRFSQGNPHSAGVDGKMLDVTSAPFSSFVVEVKHLPNPLLYSLSSSHPRLEPTSAVLRIAMLLEGFYQGQSTTSTSH